MSKSERPFLGLRCSLGGDRRASLAGHERRDGEVRYRGKSRFDYACEGVPLRGALRYNP
jgi:hypothetical protein